jgi:hypothetical protein
VTKAPGRASRSSAGRIVPLFRPYRLQVAAVIVLIVVTSTIGITNPLLIQAVFNKALFIPGGPNLHLLYVLVGIMALVPIVNGAIGILQTYETTRVRQLVMRDLRNRLYAHLETLPLSFFTNTKTGEIQSRLANDVGGVQTVVTTTASTILANVVTFVSSIVAMIGAAARAAAGEPAAAMIFLTAVGLTEHDYDDESPQRVDPGGRSGPGTGVLHRGARLRAAHRHRGVARGQAGGSGAARVERQPGATAPGQRNSDGRTAGHDQCRDGPRAASTGGREAAQRRGPAPRRLPADVLFCRPGR